MDYNLILVGIEFNEEKYSNLFPFKTMEEYITTGILGEVEIPPPPYAEQNCIYYSIWVEGRHEETSEIRLRFDNDSLKYVEISFSRYDVY